jgi:hypothetical protein
MTATNIAVDADEDNAPIDYVVADATGRILIKGRIPAFMLDIQPLQSGHVLVPGIASLDVDYVSGGKITPRPANSATLSGMTLENLPIPCTITVNGAAHACTDPTATLSFSQPGTYPVSVSAWPMYDATFEVTQS